VAQHWRPPSYPSAGGFVSSITARATGAVASEITVYLARHDRTTGLTKEDCLPLRERVSGNHSRAVEEIGHAL